MSDYDIYRDIYLIFQDAEHALKRYLKPGFSHVYIIERQALGWLCVDPSRSDLISYILPASFEHEVIETYKKRNPESTILNVHVKTHNKTAYPRLGLLSCVSVVQYYIGVYWPLVLTPYRLYNKLANSEEEHIKVIG